MVRVKSWVEVQVSGLKGLGFRYEFRVCSRV